MRVAEDEPFQTHDGSPSLADRVAESSVAVAVARFLSDHVGHSTRRGFQVALALMAILAVAFAYRSGNPNGGTSDVTEPALLGEAAERTAAGPILESRRGAFGSDSGSDNRSGLGVNDSTEPDSMAYGDPGPLDVLAAGDSATSTSSRTETTRTTNSDNVAGPSTTTATGTSASPASTTPATTGTTRTTAPASTTTTNGRKTAELSSTTTTTVATTAPTTSAPLVGPSAVPDSATTEEEESVTVKVLANDVAGDGALVPSTLRVVSGPRHAESVTVTGSHKIRYTAGEWEGTDQLTYEVCDTSNLCDTATLTIRVDDD